MVSPDNNTIKNYSINNFNADWTTKSKKIDEDANHTLRIQKIALAALTILGIASLAVGIGAICTIVFPINLISVLGIMSTVLPPVGVTAIASGIIGLVSIYFINHTKNYSNPESAKKICADIFELTLKDLSGYPDSFLTDFGNDFKFCPMYSPAKLLKAGFMSSKSAKTMYDIMKDYYETKRLNLGLGDQIRADLEVKWAKLKETLKTELPFITKL